MGFCMKDQIVIVSLRVLKLSQNLAFYLQAVIEYLPDCKTQKEAWQKVEKELSDAGLNPRYTSYESFKSGQHQYHNRRKSK